MEQPDRSHNPAEDIRPDDATPNGDADAGDAPAPFETPDEDPTPTEERTKEADPGA